MTEVIIAILGTVGTIAVALVGVWSIKRSGKQQSATIETLNGLVGAQDRKIKFLEEDAEEKAKRIEVLEREVEALKELTVRQADQYTKMIDHLLASAIPRRRKQVISIDNDKQ